MTPESLRQWKSRRSPESRWRRASIVAIGAIVDTASPELLADDMRLLAAIDAAYPFGTREMLPYKMWLLERKIFREACMVPAPPSADEAGACEVAGDLVELGRIDEARKLLEDQAPNRLNLPCPVCGQGRTRPCVDLADDARFITIDTEGARRSVTPLLVPHLSRLGLHGRDVSPGPLFEGAPR